MTWGTVRDELRTLGDEVAVTVDTLQTAGPTETDPDRLAITFSRILDNVGIHHVFVSGYVAILAGRARATEAIDILLERVDETHLKELEMRLRDADMWGPAMPLESLEVALEDRMWIARDGEMVPHLDATFVDDAIDRASLSNCITAHLTHVDEHLPIGPLELQIAYKLFLGAQKDREDALHLFVMFEDSLNIPELERWVDELDVADDYDRLRRA